MRRKTSKGQQYGLGVSPRDLGPGGATDGQLMQYSSGLWAPANTLAYTHNYSFSIASISTHAAIKIHTNIPVTASGHYAFEISGLGDDVAGGQYPFASACTFQVTGSTVTGLSNHATTGAGWNNPAVGVWDTSGNLSIGLNIGGAGHANLRFRVKVYSPDVTTPSYFSGWSIAEAAFSGYIVAAYAFTSFDTVSANNILSGNLYNGGVQIDASGASSGDVMTYNGTKWYKASPSSGWTTLSKAATTTRTNNSSPTADPDLTFAMAASTKYRIRMTIFWDDYTGTPDFVWSLTGPASPSVVQGVYKRYDSGGGTGGYDLPFQAYPSSVQFSPTYGILTIELVVHNGVNAGTFAFAWSQYNFSALQTSVLAGSYLEYKIA